MVTPKISKKGLENMRPAVSEAVPFECPFREFRDNELQIDSWGLGPVALRVHNFVVKAAVKTSHDQQIWTDDQTQPLPRSAHHFLHGWIRAEELADDRWGAEVHIFEENEVGGMSVSDMQLGHAQVLFRSSFCREVLSACFILERVEGLAIEHQSEVFSCSFGQEGWRPKFHIYSPGMKPGGGPQHKPTLSKNGCYLVRLFYLGTWRCVWVSDYVPIDSNGAPLLPFSPLLIHPPGKPGSKQVPPAVISGVIYLWPLLLTKALLKLAAPDVGPYTDDPGCVQDDSLHDFNIMHALTGCVNISYEVGGPEDLWVRITTEVPMFTWDDDDETLASTIKSRSTKKPTTKDLNVVKRTCVTYVILMDTKDCPPYQLPGITPGHEMSLLVMMARDLPLKKPLPEPEVAPWKYYRWVDWAKRHGLYAMYDCPRTRFVKVNGLLKLSYAPHLLDVQSTESITFGFIEEHATDDMSDGKKKKDKKKEQLKSALNAAAAQAQHLKEELREWIQYSEIASLIKDVHVMYYPSSFNFASAGSNPPVRLSTMKMPALLKTTDILAPKGAPLYFQLDGPEVNKLRMSLSSIHPRVLANTGSRIPDYIEKSNFVLEKFEWFKDVELPVPTGFVTTRRYQSLEIDFPPGRHFFRIWVHARVHWSIKVISDSTLLLGAKDVIQGAAVRECPWASKFLLNLGSSFTNWIKVVRSSPSVIIQADREFFRSYDPDLPWDKEVVGYDPHLRHWMFRQALQSHFQKSLNQTEWKAVAHVLRKYFSDPDFGFTEKPRPAKSLRDIANLDVCDCVMPEVEEIEFIEEQPLEEAETVVEDQKPLVDPEMMAQLLKQPKPPITSQVCELATEELPCGLLKEEREKMIRRHEAAIVLQAHWRGTWARRCLKANVTFTPEVTKYVQDHGFGTIDTLSMVMNEFFSMFPGAKYAYSVSSGLSGVYGLQQHTGTTPVTPKCVWIPYFQGVFFCHTPVKVHFEIHSNLAHSIVAIYDNDTSYQLPQAYNSHITFDIHPNVLGYTVVGHGTLTHPTGINMDAHWQLTVMSCLDGAFHVCDNEDPCKELFIPQTQKIHVDEMFFPNRRNILGGIHLSVTKHESVSFRAAASSPEVEMVAILRHITPNGESVELAKCKGKGEIYWPFIRLDPQTQKNTSSAYMSTRELNVTSARSMFKGGKAHKSAAYKSSRSLPKIKPVHEPKFYSIEVTCPSGWALSLAQWKRVDEVINSMEFNKVEHLQIQKKVVKEKEKPPKTASAKDKEKVSMPVNFAVHQPLPGDACVELECALAVGGGVVAKRDDERDQEFANARKSWDATEHGRNARGAQIRKEFREEFLDMPPPPEVSESTKSGSTFRSYNMDTDRSEAGSKDGFEGLEEEELKDFKDGTHGHEPTPATESGMLEMSVEIEEEAVYLTMPELLRDKFKPLHFVPFCMKEKLAYEAVLVTSDMAKAAAKDRQARTEAAMERMKELQLFNEVHVLGRQRDRCQALEKLFVDATMCPELLEVMEQREEAMKEEVLARTASANKKKMEAKKMEIKKTEVKKTEGKRKQ